MSRRPTSALLAVCTLVLSTSALLGTTAAHADGGGVFGGPRADQPIVLTGAQLPQWSRLAATGAGSPTSTAAADKVRSAHNGTIVVPPDARTGADPDQVAAYRWTGTAWQQVPVQVDQKFPHFLANAHSSFAFYSGTDQELTYSWAPDAHATGEEAWKKIFGDCTARYADPDTLAADIAAMSVPNPAAGSGGTASNLPAYSPAPGETAMDYTHAMADPVPTLDDDDEIAMQAADAGPAAPVTQAAPAGTTAGSGHTVAVTDPASPGSVGFLYLFLKPGGSSYDSTNGYVQMTRDPNADEFIDRNSFKDGSNENLSSSNSNYGPNVRGTVCRTDPSRGVDNVPRTSNDRFPRDGITVTTDRYRLRATGRWMVRSYQVAKPSEPGVFGPDLIDRWKGRAFQQNPDSSISVVGFEDEQVNWEANGALLGWRQGPVRAIREIWGADSGTNVTKTETYYRDADTYRYRVRVHPIPPDGLYTSWDYNPGAVTTYFNTVKTAGVAVDGANDDTGQIDSIPVMGTPAFFDAPDPSFDLVSAIDRPEEVAGPNGGLVYAFEFKGNTSAANADAVPYYRDDACLDDGTGDAPAPRPWPGETSTDSRVKAGYVDYWKAQGAPSTLTYADLKCQPTKPAAMTQADYDALPQWQKTPFQGAFASHGIHFFVTHDSDNGEQPLTIDEVDGQQWRYAVPMSTATNVIDADGPNWALNIIAPLTATVAPYGEVQPSTDVPEVPMAVALPLAALVIGGTAYAVQRRRSRRTEP